MIDKEKLLNALREDEKAPLCNYADEYANRLIKRIEGGKYKLENKKCKWKYELISKEISAYDHSHGLYTYHTECGEFSDTMGCSQPERDKIYKFCHYCGKEIEYLINE